MAYSNNAQSHTQIVTGHNKRNRSYELKVNVCTDHKQRLYPNQSHHNIHIKILHIHSLHTEKSTKQKEKDQQTRHVDKGWDQNNMCRADGLIWQQETRKSSGIEGTPRSIQGHFPRRYSQIPRCHAVVGYPFWWTAYSAMWCPCGWASNSAM